MVTKFPKRAAPQLYIKQWRKFMGVKPLECALAIKVERGSYHRLEKNWETFSVGELKILAELIGVHPDQFWFPPPTPGQETVSIDDLLRDEPEPVQKMAVAAVRGMIGK